MAARSAMPYGTWRGSSSSRMTGLTKRILAMQEFLQGSDAEGRADEDAAVRAVRRRARSLARHLQKHLAEPVVGGIGEPALAQVGPVHLDERLPEALAQDGRQLRVVLRLLVRRAGRVAEVEAHQPQPRLAQGGVGEDPRRGADVAAPVQAWQRVGGVQPA